MRVSNVIICAVLLGTTMGTLITYGADDDAATTVEYLLSLPHGPTRTNDRGRELLDRLRHEPEKFRAAIRERLVLPENDAELDGVGSLTSLRLGRTLGLAQALGKERGAPMVRDFHNALRKRLEEVDRPTTAPTTAPAGIGPVPPHVATLRHLERGALDVMAAFEDPAAVPYVLDTIEHQGPATRTVMLQYLAVLAKHDPTIRPRLRKIVDQPTSPLNRDPFARSVLDSMATTQPGG